jgi:DNA-binding response OmpR family regulator
MIKLLFIEDDANLSYIVQSSLQYLIGGYEVQTASNGEEGLNAWAECKPDIIVSDIDMPIMDGMEMVKHIRKMDGEIPIMFTSALTSPKDVKKGYEMGVNNYVKKPFTPEELDCHIQALLKMKIGAKMRTETDLYRWGHYTFDAERATLYDNKTHKQKTLTAREAGILHLLAANANEVVRREVILKQYWETEDNVFASRSLDVFVSHLRSYIKEDPNVQIETVRNVGLKLVVAQSQN